MAECTWDPNKHGGKPCPVHGGGGGGSEPSHKIRIDKGKYQTKVGDNDWEEVSPEEYNELKEGGYQEFDETVDDDFGFDEDNKGMNGLLKQMSEDGIDLNDRNDVKQYLGATLGLDREDQEAIMEHLDDQGYFEDEEDGADEEGDRYFRQRYGDRSEPEEDNRDDEDEKDLANTLVRDGYFEEGEIKGIKFNNDEEGTIDITTDRGTNRYTYEGGRLYDYQNNEDEYNDTDLYSHDPNEGEGHDYELDALRERQERGLDNDDDFYDDRKNENLGPDKKRGLKTMSDFTSIPHSGDSVELDGNVVRFAGDRMFPDRYAVHWKDGKTDIFKSRKEAMNTVLDRVNTPLLEGEVEVNEQLPAWMQDTQRKNNEAVKFAHSYPWQGTESREDISKLLQEKFEYVTPGQGNYIADIVRKGDAFNQKNRKGIGGNTPKVPLSSNGAPSKEWFEETFEEEISDDDYAEIVAAFNKIHKRKK